MTMGPMSSAVSLDLSQARLGVLGGSGLYAMDGLEDLREHKVDTPYGPPSDSLRIGRIGDLEVVFLARHGRHHTFSPTEVPYRANLWALRSLGVRWILSCSAVGSLQEHLRPLDMVVPDQFIDRTHHRPLSFFGNGAVAFFIPTFPPFSFRTSLLTSFMNLSSGSSSVSSVSIFSSPSFFSVSSAS
jgi:5'-methylthioadenosine phosphorylase